MGLAESVTRFATPAQLAKVREYVRAGNNRVWIKRGTALDGRSKPMREIAAELEMRRDSVREAMLDSGWGQAVEDAERAERTPTIEDLPRFRPWGPEE